MLRKLGLSFGDGKRTCTYLVFFYRPTPLLFSHLNVIETDESMSYTPPSETNE
jgi:hypothetical protein